MKTRDSMLLAVRPEIDSAKVNSEMSTDEHFQNSTLRPIAKFQNDLLLASFRNYIVKHKNVFYDLTPEKRMDYIDTAINKDMKFRNSLKGILIGQFTLKEFNTYIQNSSALNKRMMDIVKERIKSQVQLLEVEFV